MTFVTDFADLGLVLPLAFATGLALLLAGWQRAALAWAIAVPGTFAVVLVAKMVVAACGPFPVLHGLKSPSGHTASAAVVFGGLFALLLPRPQPPGWRIKAAVLFAIACATLVGATRLALHLHTRTDVLVGAGIGVIGAYTLARLAGPRPDGVRLALPLAAVVALGLLLHGEHLRAEQRIDRIARMVWPLSLCCHDPGGW
jgi:membrane-associated phospholipid phosphatase